MRKMRVLVMLATLFGLVMAGAAPQVLAQGESCPLCGMKQAKFAHSWMTLAHEDGSTVGLCSLHCAAIHMALHIDKPVTKVTVGDYNTKEQIDAEKAHWVIGGEKMGVMTTRAKWAFTTREAANQFMDQHGGSPATFQNAMKAAFEDMYEDTLMIQKKRKMMRMKKSGS